MRATAAERRDRPGRGPHVVDRQRAHWPCGCSFRSNYREDATALVVTPAAVLVNTTVPLRPAANLLRVRMGSRRMRPGGSARGPQPCGPRPRRHHGRDERETTSDGVDGPSGDYLLDGRR